MNILDQVVKSIVYKDYDASLESFEEFHRSMLHDEFLSAAMKMYELNQIRNNH